ncbi:carboxypeptidase S [Pseudohyphozyma bogoriensis]|nr:carboxypeptidase S [Pseudohyphozyma bogoriensis]
MDAEKQLLKDEPPLLERVAKPRHSVLHLALLWFAVILGARFISTSLPTFVHDRILSSTSSSTSSGVCVQYPAVKPPADAVLDANKEHIFSADYRNKSAVILSGLVQVRSESFDDLGVIGEDPRWDVFYTVEEYLKKTFPLVHDKLELEHVNTHGLVYTWRGSDSALKPAMLMAHQDTVPVPNETLDQWTYPPFEGKYDGTYVWGRGVSDYKNSLASTLEAITLLLEAGFQPRRTIVLSYGFDEECGGLEGALPISRHIQDVYGPDSVAFIMDEGGMGISKMGGAVFAMPSTAEKGYTDVHFELHTPGGHSSVPPPHTGIGILSEIVVSLEAISYEPSLSTTSPVFELLQCAATRGTLSDSLKANVLAGNGHSKKARKARHDAAVEYAKGGRSRRYVVSTSQAADVVRGGVKINAIPEYSEVVINHRVSIDSTLESVYSHIKDVVLPIAEKHGLTLNIFNETIRFEPDLAEDIPGGELKIYADRKTIKPAPISPTSAPQWALLSSTIQHVYADQYPQGLTVAPSIMTGNTDTKFMWNLTQHIYRFSPMDRSRSGGTHTVDERLFFDDHISGIYFYHELLRNADVADLP